MRDAERSWDKENQIPKIKDVLSRFGQTQRAAFSLIETLGALLLAAILMVTVLQLLRNLHLQERQVEQVSAANPPWLNRVCRILERDFQNARQMKVTDDGIQLSGFSMEGENEHLPALQRGIVTYAVAVTERNGQSLVIRSEDSDEVISNRSVSGRVIAVGISELSFWYQETVGVRYLPSKSSDWVPTPRAITVRLVLPARTKENGTTDKQPRTLTKSLIVRPNGRWFR